MRARMSCLVALLAWVVPAALALAPAAWASGSSCKVTDKATRQSYSDLQSAVNAASAGDRLLVQGTCTGTTTIAIGLTVQGTRASGDAAPTLDGGGGGSVLTIMPGIRVAIRSLTITNGVTASSDLGGGITDEGGVVTVIDSTITANSAMFGGGIENNQGRVVVEDSVITGNDATVDGGGIDTFPSGSVTVRGATSVNDNTAGLNGGGIAHFGSGNLTLRNTSTVAGNSAVNGGGGIYDANTGTVTLHDTSNVHDNTAGGDGGGINNHGGGTIAMHRKTSVYGNVAGGDGGGIFNNGGRLKGVVAAGNVFANTPNDVA